MSSEFGQRRPIKARDFALTRIVAHWLARRDVNPNGISIFGLLWALLGGLMLGLADGTTMACWLAVVVCVEMRLLCNMFDGMVAIERGVASKIGEIYNEVPDRVADIAVLVGLGYAPGGMAWLGYVAALMAVFAAYLRVLGVSLGMPADFSGSMAKQFRMHTVALAALICAGAVAADLDYRSAAGQIGVPAIALVIIAIGTIGTSLRRLTHLFDRLR